MSTYGATAAGRRITDDVAKAMRPVGPGLAIRPSRKMLARYGKDADAIKQLEARRPFYRRSGRKAQEFVERFAYNPETGRRDLRHSHLPDLKTSLPRGRSLTAQDKEYLGLPGGSGGGTLQGTRGLAHGELVDYPVNGNRRVRKGFSRQGVTPILARVRPAAGHGGRRVLTGDAENVRRVVGKALPLNTALNAVRGGASALKGGYAAGRAGAKPSVGVLAPKMQNVANAGAAMGRNPLQTGLAGGAVGTATLTGGGQRRPSLYAPPTPMYGGFGKRSYDPENNRRWRQGAAAATGTIAGTALGASGVRDVLAPNSALSTLRSLPKQDQHPPPTPRVDVYTSGHAKGQPKSAPDLVKDKKWLEVERIKRAKHNQAAGALNALRGTKGRLVTGRAAGKIAGGVALLGASGTLFRNRHEEKWD